MKFTTSFLTVLAATSTLAAPTTKSCNQILNKKYSTCSSVFSGSGFNENYCIEYETELCQKYFNSSLKEIYAEIPECKDILNDIEEEETILYDSMRYAIKIACTKDEQGNFCPYSPANTKTAIDLKGMRRKERNVAYNEYVKESCKSKKCVDEYLKYIEAGIQMYSSTNKMTQSQIEEKKEMQELATYLKSETCTAHNVKTNINGNDNGNTSNNGNTTNNGNTSGVISSGTNTNGKVDTSSGNTNDKKETSNDNGNDKNDAKSGATKVTYSSILFVGLAILLSTLY